MHSHMDVRFHLTQLREFLNRAAGALTEVTGVLRTLIQAENLQPAYRTVAISSAGFRPATLHPIHTSHARAAAP